ncbi:MAG TPA: hydrogenase 2 operon protein HybA [bacterium]|nr:hydrogenase 2 operon protein HybA [bacterium]
MNRREFLKKSGLALVGGGAVASVPEIAEASGHAKQASPEALGVLVDTTLCIGCRECERACERTNHVADTPLTDEYFDDKSVFDSERALSVNQYTVVNKYPNPVEIGDDGAVYVKKQCMHCVHAPCVSACIVGAFKKDEKTGAVTYNAWECIGCRYCMMACPFQVPTNEFGKAIEPRIKKCTFCFDRISKYNGTPACADACPMGAMTFGKRSELIEVARERIKLNPDKYLNHIYGEHEAGGTSWMYLAGMPFDKIGFPKLADTSPAMTSETLMHSAFKHWIPPFSIYAAIGATMWIYTRKKQSDEDE